MQDPFSAHAAYSPGALFFGLKCAGELESLLYTVLYWFSNGHLAWETDGGRIEVAVALKESVMALHFEVRCRP